MNEKWFDECSVVAYPHEIRFLHIDGGSISYCVDRNVSEYVRKIQTQLNTLQNENREKDIKIMILQSKIDKAIEFVESMEYCGQEDYFYDNKSKDPCGNDNTFNDSKNKLLNILKEDK